jgi:hypothetical protein
MIIRNYWQRLKEGDRNIGIKEELNILILNISFGPSPRDAPWSNKTKELGIPTLIIATKTREVPT